MPPSPHSRATPRERLDGLTRELPDALGEVNRAMRDVLSINGPVREPLGSFGVDEDLEIDIDLDLTGNGSDMSSAEDTRLTREASEREEREREAEGRARRREANALELRRMEEDAERLRLEREDAEDHLESWVHGSEERWSSRPVLNSSSFGSALNSTPADDEAALLSFERMARRGERVMPLELQTPAQLGAFTQAAGAQLAAGQGRAAANHTSSVTGGYLMREHLRDPTATEELHVPVGGSVTGGRGPGRVTTVMPGRIGGKGGGKGLRLRGEVARNRVADSNRNGVGGEPNRSSGPGDEVPRLPAAGVRGLLAIRGATGGKGLSGSDGGRARTRQPLPRHRGARTLPQVNLHRSSQLGF